jgi:cysteine desulfuration protein SufE
MTIDEVQLEIIDEFSSYGDWMDKYSYLIGLGNELPPIPESEKKESYLIRGCQSRVWLVPEFREGKIYFRGESDAVIVKGLVALLLRVASGRTPGELLNCDFRLLDEIGLKQHLSPVRANGLLAMVKQIRLYAVAYNKIQEKND